MSKPLTTITGTSTEEISSEIWELLDSVIDEKLYENGVDDEHFEDFKKEISAQLVDNLEENL